MPRTPPSSPSRLSRDAQHLISLTESLALSGCRLEDTYWENLLGQHLTKLLRGRRNKHIESVLEYLLDNNLNAYEILVEQAETFSESITLSVGDRDYDVLLISAPLVAWTRYQIPGGVLEANAQTALASKLLACVAAPGARLALIPELVGFEQMPRTFQETWVWAHRLGLAALDAKTEPCDIHKTEDSEGMLADARFLVGAIVVPQGAPLFRWQADAPDTPTREQCLQAWTHECAETLGTLFTGCTLEYMLPDAYYVNSREADRRVRPLALRAAVTWLHTAVGLPPSDVRATIVGCGDSVPEEFRVGFSTRQSNDVIYGCVWPVLSKEESLTDSSDTAQADTPDQIAALLKELGVQDIRRLPGIQPAEYCDDCGAPYFPNPLGEMQHPEIPDEVDLNPVHFH
ncbi:MAG TPA: DUF2863 family protein [Burkholderiaceae bacterium]|nr:DUF2863 family protein [Burkholderiaceae bacterium]